MDKKSKAAKKRVVHQISKTDRNHLASVIFENSPKRKSTILQENDIYEIPNVQKSQVLSLIQKYFTE